MANESQLNELLESPCVPSRDDRLDPDLQLSDEEVVTPLCPARSITPNVTAAATACAPSHPASSSSVSSHLTGKARKKARKKEQSHKRRQKSRQETAAHQFSHHTSRPNVEKKYVVADHAENTEVNMANSKVARTAYVGLNDAVREKKTYALEELVGPGSKFGFRLLKYKKG